MSVTRTGLLCSFMSASWPTEADANLHNLVASILFKNLDANDDGLVSRTDLPRAGQKRHTHTNTH